MPITVRKEYTIKSSENLKPEDAKIIGPVLQEMADISPVRVEDVVEAAQSTNNPLHDFFEWNDQKAAILHRNSVARDMIRSVRVHIVTVDGKQQGKGLAAQKIEMQTVSIRPVASPKPAPIAPARKVAANSSSKEDPFFYELNTIPPELHAFIPKVLARISRMIAVAAEKNDSQNSEYSSDFKSGMANAITLIQLYSRIFKLDDTDAGLIIGVNNPKGLMSDELETNSPYSKQMET